MVTIEKPTFWHIDFKPGSEKGTNTNVGETPTARKAENLTDKPSKGIRSYSWLTSLFVGLKTEIIKHTDTKTGETYYLNSKSVAHWATRHGIKARLIKENKTIDEEMLAAALVRTIERTADAGSMALGGGSSGSSASGASSPVSSAAASVDLSVNATNLLQKAAAIADASTLTAFFRDCDQTAAQLAPNALVQVEALLDAGLKKIIVSVEAQQRLYPSMDSSAKDAHRTELQQLSTTLASPSSALVRLAPQASENLTSARTAVNRALRALEESSARLSPSPAPSVLISALSPLPSVHPSVVNPVLAGVPLAQDLISKINLLALSMGAVTAFLAEYGAGKSRLSEEQQGEVEAAFRGHLNPVYRALIVQLKQDQTNVSQPGVADQFLAGNEKLRLLNEIYDLCSGSVLSETTKSTLANVKGGVSRGLLGSFYATMVEVATARAQVEAQRWSDDDAFVERLATGIPVEGGTVSLRREQVPGDGNCLFASCVKQLKRLKFEKYGSWDEVAAPTLYRTAVYNHISGNIEKYREGIEMILVAQIAEIVQASDGDVGRKLSGYPDALKEAYLAIRVDCNTNRGNPGHALDNLSAAFITADGVGKYITAMINSKGYGGEIELSAIRDMEDLPIRIFSRRHQGNFIDLIDHTKAKPVYSKAAWINLFLPNEQNHYDALR